MKRVELTCSACRRVLPGDSAAFASMQACPNCGTRVEVFAFPAVDRPPAPQVTPPAVAHEGDASCFFHSSRKAAIPCDECGRFLCALCDLEIEGRHLCPTCLQAGQEKRTLTALEQSRTRWDRIVWALNLLCLFCLILSPLIALANLIITCVFWKAPPSRVSASRAWMVAGTLLSIAGGVLTVVLFSLENL